MEPKIMAFAVDRAMVGVQDLNGQLRLMEKLLARARMGIFLVRVELKTRWKNEGEQDVVLRGVDLRKTFRRAVKKFEKVNRRTDRQFTADVYVVFGKYCAFPVPDEVWQPLVE
jgi:hypothetical protein